MTTNERKYLQAMVKIWDDAANECRAHNLHAALVFETCAAQVRRALNGELE